jgi:pyrimidine deaminase RibD-like protein
MATSKFLAKAVETARAGHGKFKHGAILVKNGEIISEGHNQMRGQASITATAHSWRASFLHAEEVALKNAGTAANGAVLYVARVGRSGDIRNSKPCVRCASKIARAGVRRVVFT